MFLLSQDFVADRAPTVFLPKSCVTICKLFHTFELQLPHL